MDGWPPVFRFGRVEIVPTDEHETASTVPPKANTKSNTTGTARRRSRRTWAIAAAAVAALGVLIYWLHSRRFESTDDAQIDADVSDIGARVGGTVTRVGIIENQAVHAGDILAEVDPTDLEVAVAQARAAVAQAEAQLAAEDQVVPMTETSNAAALTSAASELASASALLTERRQRGGAGARRWRRPPRANTTRSSTANAARSCSPTARFREPSWIAASPRPTRRRRACAPQKHWLSRARGHAATLTATRGRLDFRTALELRAFQAVGLAFLFVPINTLIYEGVPPEKNNQVSGIVNLARNMGGDIGIAFVTTMAARRTQFHQARLTDHTSRYDHLFAGMLDAITRSLQHAGVPSAAAAHRALAVLYRQTIMQATTLAYLDVLHAFALMAALMIPFLWLAHIRPGAAPARPAIGHP